jgi:hypothetical protein
LGLWRVNQYPGVLGFFDFFVESNFLNNENVPSFDAIKIIHKGPLPNLGVPSKMHGVFCFWHFSTKLGTSVDIKLFKSYIQTQQATYNVNIDSNLRMGKLRPFFKCQRFSTEGFYLEISSVI